MADSRQAIKDLYDEGMAEVFRVVGSLDATKKQRQVAKQTAKDLSTMLVVHTLSTIEGRTALLSGLIVELNQVIESIQTKPPYADALASFTAILTKAKDLYKKEKSTGLG